MKNIELSNVVSPILSSSAKVSMNLKNLKTSAQIRKQLYVYQEKRFGEQAVPQRSSALVHLSNLIDEFFNFSVSFEQQLSNLRSDPKTKSTRNVREESENLWYRRYRRRLQKN